MGSFHRVANLRYEGCWYFLVKEIAHGINKDHARLTPTKWLIEARRSQRQIEASFKWVARCPAKPFGEPLRVTIVAALADLGASGHRIPSGVGPFDRCGVGHVQTFEGEGIVAHSRIECTFPADY